MNEEEVVQMDDLSSSTILLVEDSEADIVLLKRALRNARIANPLMVVRDGEEAINYFSGAGVYGNRERWPIPSLVLLDLRLPKVSGFEVLEWIRSRPDLNEVTVVVLTGSENVPDVSKAHELGADSYLVKPGEFRELVAMVERIHGHWLMLLTTPDQPT